MNIKTLLRILFTVALAVCLLTALALTVGARPANDNNIYVGETQEVRIAGTYSSEPEEGNCYDISISDSGDPTNKKSNMSVGSVEQDGDEIVITVKGVSVTAEETIGIAAKIYNSELSEWKDGILYGAYHVLANDCTLDFENDQKSLNQNYALTLTSASADVTKVKVEWTITDITATRKDAKKWNTETLSWDDDDDNDVVTPGEATATFKITNYSSVKVKAKVEFSAESGFNPAVVYTGVDATNHEVVLETASGSAIYSAENLPKADVTIKVTPAASDFAAASATASTVYGTYTVSIGKLTPVVTAPSANTLTYSGDAQELVTAGTTTVGTMKYAVSDTEPSDGDFETSLPTATDAGTYKVWYKVDGGAGYESTEAQNLSVTIGKMTPTVTAPTANELFYTGEAQELITAGSTTGGTLKYAVSETLPADADFAASIPTATATGEYTVFYKVFGDGNCESSIMGYVDVIVSKLPVEVTNPTANEITYTGEEQALITAGSTNHGTLKYAVADDEPADEAYSESIPTATNAGTYTVWFKSFGDDVYTDSDGDYVEVVLEKAEQEEPDGKCTYSDGTLSIELFNAAACKGDILYSLYGETWQTSNEFTGLTETIYQAYIMFTETENYKSSSVYASDCLAKGTKISMADGTQKNIEDIKEGDEVLTFNHETGKFEAQKVYLAWAGNSPKRAFTLHFTSGIEISVIGDHCFFERESLAYVAIFECTAEQYIGKHFYNAVAGRYEELLSVTYDDTPVDYYEIYTEYNANCIAENMLNVAYDSSELLNIYAFNEDLSIDHEQLARDIAEYGIFEYAENDRYTKEQYDALGWKYGYVMVGKGFGTMEEFQARADAFLAEEY